MQSDADSLFATVQMLNAAVELEELDEAAVRSLSYTARGDLAPMNAFFGGLAAQEVIKVMSKISFWITLMFLFHTDVQTSVHRPATALKNTLLLVFRSS